MTYSGTTVIVENNPRRVLIPLLLDDLLWVMLTEYFTVQNVVLIPLLLDDLLWVVHITPTSTRLEVLIPLLLDDLLWANLLTY